MKWPPLAEKLAKFGSMPIFRLDYEITFPPAELADQDGILAIGGDLSPQRLIRAYSDGIFPWYSDGQPILWWSPDPRMVLYPANLRISKSMQQVIKSKKFSITLDKEFEAVITACKMARGRDRRSTWITAEMRNAYIELHRLGYAHSVEVWADQKLAGGLYGVSLGSVFFGESMFTRISNASKFGFIQLVCLLHEKKFTMIDCQVPSEHLSGFGAEEIGRPEFLSGLKEGLKDKTLEGNWGELV